MDASPMWIVEFAIGLVLAALTLRDLFHTVVVPGEPRGSLRIPRRLIDLTLPLVTGRSKEVGLGYAPAILLGSFTVWVLLLIVSFGLMAHAAASQFSPALGGFGEAAYLAASTLATVGIGDAQPSRLASVVVAAAGLCGLAAMTMAVTYVLQMQSNTHERDAGILKLTTSAGKPPSGLGLLERYAALGAPEELAGVLRNARDWCAGVQQSHASHPSLIYFRSRSVESSWPTAVGALLDAALITELLLDEGERSGLAILTREEGEGLASVLAGMLRLEVVEKKPSPEDVHVLLRRLAIAGYRVRTDVDEGAFARTRATCSAAAQALCRHLGTPEAPLLPQASD
ncbi:MAG: ion channel [Luteimonas sp.]